MPGLREKATADNKAILNDDKGFAWPITVTNPAEVSADLKGFSNDIALLIDPDTGEAVSGRTASVALHTADLTALGLPVGIMNPKSKPWIMEFDDINGNPGVFKVKKSFPDGTIGMIVCVVEVYKK